MTRVRLPCEPHTLSDVGLKLPPSSKPSRKRWQSLNLQRYLRAPEPFLQHSLCAVFAILEIESMFTGNKAFVHRGVTRRIVVSGASCITSSQSKHVDEHWNRLARITRASAYSDDAACA